jgi:WD40 repeat protein
MLNFPLHPLNHSSLIRGVSSGTPPANAEYQEVLHIPPSGFTPAFIKWNPVNNQLALGEFEGTRVQILDVQTGKPLLMLETPKLNEFVPQTPSSTPSIRFTLEALEWSPNGSYLAVAYNFDITDIWELSEGQTAKVLTIDHPGSKPSISWSSDSRDLAIAQDVDQGQRGVVRDVFIWDAISGTQIASLQGNISQVTNIYWSPNGKEIATVTSTGNVEIWDATTYKRTLEFPQLPKDFLTPVSSLAWSSNSKFIGGAGCNLSVGGCHLWVWTPEARQLETPFQDRDVNREPMLGYPSSLAWKPETLQLLTIGSDTELWDLRTGQSVANFGHKFGASWSSKGTMLATINGDRSVSIWAN